MKKWFMYLICYGLGFVSLWLGQTALRYNSQPKVSDHLANGPITLLYFMRMNLGALTYHEIIPHISEDKPYNNYDVYDFSALFDKHSFQKMVCEAQALSQERKRPMELWLPYLNALSGKQKQWDNERMFKYIAQKSTEVHSLVVTVSINDIDHIVKYFPSLETLTLLSFSIDTDGLDILNPEKIEAQKLQIKSALQRLGKMKSLKYLLVCSNITIYFSKEELQEAIGNPNIQIYGDF